MRFSRTTSFLTFLLLCLSGCWGVSPVGPASNKALKYHRVQAGETLSSISQDYDVSVEELVRLNKLANPDVLAVGERLRLPNGVRSAFAFGPSARVSKRFGPMGTVYTHSLAPRDMQAGRLAWPVLGGKLISAFGPRGGRFHDGIDISAQRGTPVLAAHDGVVLRAGMGLSGFGRLIVVRGDDGLLTLYAHNYRLGVKEGDRVVRGQSIAEVGKSGNASGPHLHFEVRMRDPKGRTVSLDPIPLLRSSPEKLPDYRVNEALNRVVSP